MESLVTVICCTYNHEKYIRKTLDGFLKQRTDFSVHYIIHDDASTDQTATIMREYDEKHPGFFHMIYEKENQWAKRTTPDFTTRCIMSSNDKYIAFCEGDDYWIDQDKLQLQVDIMEKDPSITLCLHGHYLLNDKTGALKKERSYYHFGYISTKDGMLEPYSMPATCSMMMRTEIIRTYPYDTLYCPIGDRNRRLFLADKGNIYYIDRPMSVYRINNSNSFGSTMFNYEKSLSIVEQMVDFYDRYNEYTERRHESIIPLLKEREYIAHYNRFGEFEKIVETEYFKKVFSFKRKCKLYAKWKLSRLYSIYKKVNKIDR